MRHLIFTIFLLTLAPIASFAATSCPSDATLETCSTNPGCYWNEATATCTLCPAGTYNAGGTGNTSKTECISCGNLNGNGMGWDSSVTGQESANCRWIAHCQPGEYFTSKLKGCQKCSTNNANTNDDVLYNDYYYYGPDRALSYLGYSSINNNTIYILGSAQYNNGTNISLSLNNDQGEIQHKEKFCRRCGDYTKTNDAGTNCDCQDGYHKELASNSCQDSAYTSLQSSDWNTIFTNWNDYLTCLDATKTCSNSTIKNIITPANCVLNTYTITLNHNSDNDKTETIDYTTYNTAANDTEPKSYTNTIVVTGVPINTTEFSLPDSEKKTDIPNYGVDWSSEHDKFVRSGYNLSAWTAPNNTEYGPYRYYNPTTLKCGLNGKYPQLQQNLTANWTEVKFNITYEINEGEGFEKAPGPTECSVVRECPAPHPNQGLEGYKFQEWNCKITETNEDCSTATLETGSNLAEISGGKGITLTAIWQECPTGYYCATSENGNATPCPAGTTSDAGSDEKKDCYMLGGTTKIQGNNGTFTLPTDLNLYYRGS